MKTPMEICFSCDDRHNPSNNKNRGTYIWDIACKGNKWLCPSKIKPDTRTVSYPPANCPYRAELLMLKDAGHMTPKKVF